MEAGTVVTSGRANGRFVTTVSALPNCCDGGIGLTCGSMTNKKPAEVIAGLVADRAKRTDQELLSELKKFKPLPPEANDAWSSEATWARAHLFVALADLSAKRKLRAAAPLLLERAALGDPGELMRGLRHSLENIFKPDWPALVQICITQLQTGPAGARAWALDQLAVLRDPKSLEAILTRLTDEQAEVREFARQAVVMLCDGKAELAATAIKALEAANVRFPREGDDAIRDLER